MAGNRPRLDRHRRLLRGVAPLLVALAFALALAGCTVRFVDDYDRDSEALLIASYGRIVRLYDRLLDAPPAERRYARHAEAWADLDAELRVLLLRQQARPLNAESTAIVAQIVATTERNRTLHRDKDAYPDALLRIHRERYAQLYRAALTAERIRKDEE